MDPTLILNQKFNGIWKSEPVSAYFWYYIPVSDPSRQNMSNGKWRVDAEWDWTLSPKWIVGYYVNPRQTLIPDHKVSNADSGMTNQWRTRDLVLQNQTFDTAFGMTMTFGKILLTAEVDNNYGLKEDYAPKPGTVWSAEENFTYLMQADLAF